MITEHLHFAASSRHFGEIVTAAYVLVIAFVPLFFLHVLNRRHSEFHKYRLLSDSPL